jgi:membrane-associated protease RseP (regulator of RpoE activity)
MWAFLIVAVVSLNPYRAIAQVPLPEPGLDEDYGPDFPEPAQQSRTAEKRTSADEPARLGVTLDPQTFDSAVVSSIAPNSPAERAGLTIGDTIEALNGLRVRSRRDVHAIVELLRSGDVIEIDYSRRITARTQATLDAQPQDGRGDVNQLDISRRQYADRASYEELPSPAATGEELQQTEPRRIPVPRYRNTPETGDSNRQSVEQDRLGRSINRGREQDYRGRRYNRRRR